MNGPEKSIISPSSTWLQQKASFNHPTIHFLAVIYMWWRPRTPTFYRVQNEDFKQRIPKPKIQIRGGKKERKKGKEKQRWTVDMKSCRSIKECISTRLLCQLGFIWMSSWYWKHSWRILDHDHLSVLVRHRLCLSQGDLSRSISKPALFFVIPNVYLT